MRQQQTGNDVVQDSRTQRENHTDVLMCWPARGPYARHLTIKPKTGYNFVPTHVSRPPVAKFQSWRVFNAASYVSNEHK